MKDILDRLAFLNHWIWFGFFVVSFGYGTLVQLFENPYFFLSWEEIQREEMHTVFPFWLALLFGCSLLRWLISGKIYILPWKELGKPQTKLATPVKIILWGFVAAIAFALYMYFQINYNGR
jgi:hypothetical protein